MELARRDSQPLNAATEGMGLSQGSTKKNKHRNIFSFLSYRIHGNKHRQPVHALSEGDVRRVVLFVNNYTEDHAILLPGRIPGYNRFDLKLLPSNTSKLHIWELYAESVRSFGGRVVGYRSFRNIWSKYLPQVLITKPMSDLCWICQQNISLIMRSSNKSEEEKSAVSNMLILTHKKHAC